MAADLSKRAALRRVADRVADRERPIDLLVNNAGFGTSRSFLKGDLADEEAMLDVLCHAVLVLSHAGALSMKDRGRGAIINVSSVAGFVPMGTYGAAKGWCTAFTENLAHELAGSGVSATALCPGFTHTELHERANVDMSKLPKVMWLEADRLVRDCLDDVKTWQGPLGSRHAVQGHCRHRRGGAARVGSGPVEPRCLDPPAQALVTTGMVVRG